MPLTARQYGEGAASDAGTMSTTERMLLATLFGILLAAMSWLLATVTLNSTRISVLEQRTSNHVKAMDDFKDELREHRNSTESRTGNGTH